MARWRKSAPSGWAIRSSSPAVSAPFARKFALGKEDSVGTDLEMFACAATLKQELLHMMIWMKSNDRFEQELDADIKRVIETWSKAIRAGYIKPR